MSMTEVNEIWKPVKGYNGKYEVSNKGFVRTLSYRNKEGNVMLLSRVEDTDGAYRVNLYRKDTKYASKYKLRPIAQLVAEAFIKKPHFKPSEMDKVNVIHINGDAKDDRVENLRWATVKTMCNKKSALERRSKARRGKPNPNAHRKAFEERTTVKQRVSVSKLTQEQRDNISRVRQKKPVVQLSLDGALIKVWKGGNEAEQMLKQSGILQPKISDCCRGKRYSAGGFKWQFKEEYEKEHKIMVF